MIRRGLPGVIALTALLGLTLTGCGIQIVIPPTGTQNPVPSDTASPAETPTSDPAPSEGPAGGAEFTPQDIFDRCVTLVSTELYAGEPVTVGSFDTADVIKRTDGLWYVYVEVSIDDEPDPELSDVAFECILGGTYGEPNDALYGKRPRADLAHRNPDSPLSVEE